MLLSQRWRIQRDCTSPTVKVYQKCHFTSKLITLSEPTGSTFLFNRLYFLIVLYLWRITPPGLDRAMTKTGYVNYFFPK